MKQLLTFVAVGITVLAIAACGGGDGEQITPTEPAAATATTPAGGETPTNGGGDGVAVMLEDPGGSGEYIFDPSEFTFSAGEAVTFNLTSETEYHTFTVDDLGIHVDVDADTTETLTHTFSESGTYELICIPHETLGMTGTITVQ